MAAPHSEDYFTDSDNEDVRYVRAALKTGTGEASLKTTQLVSYGDDAFEDSSSEKEEVKSNGSQVEETEPYLNIAKFSVQMFPEPKGKCDPELQEKIKKMMKRMKETDCDWNCVIQERKSFRNPSIYEKLIEFCDINEFGTNYKPEIYDPTKWEEKSFYDELHREQKLEMDKRKEKAKVEPSTGTIKSSGSLSDTGNKKRKNNVTEKEISDSNITCESEEKIKMKRDNANSPAALKAKSLVSVVVRAPHTIRSSFPLALFRKTKTL